MLQNPHQPFDAIVQSLVLNFQGDPRRRGDMLALAADPRMLAKNGLLFVALPSASLENSRYCTSEHFVQIARTLGLQTLDVKKSAKLILLTFKAVRHSIGLKTQRFIYDVDTRQFNYPQEVGRKELRRGRNRNNFAVMLKVQLQQWVRRILDEMILGYLYIMAVLYDESPILLLPLLFLLLLHAIVLCRLATVR